MEGTLKGKGAARIKDAGLQIRSEAKLLKDWLTANRWKWIASACLFVAVYATWMFGSNPRIDTEVVINDPYSMVGWPGIGRQGLILTEYVFGLRWFNPLFSTALGFAVFFLSALLMAYLFVRIGKVGDNAALLFTALYASSPIFTEIFYFNNQFFDVAFAGLLCVLAVGADFFGIEKKNGLFRAAAVLAMIWVFSSYQAFLPLYIGLTAAYYVLLCQRRDALSLSLLIRLIADFLIAFLINSVITKAFFSSGAYLDTQNMWLMLPFFTCVKHIAGHVVRGFFGLKAFYSGFYIVFAACAVVTTAVRVSKSDKKKLEKLLHVLLIAAVQLIPFMLTVVMGGAPAVRAQMAYPFILAFDMVYCLHLLKGNKKLGCIVCLLAVVAVFSQTKTTMRFVYTDNIRAQEDIHLTWELFSRIAEETQEDKPLLFVGERESRLNAACLRGEVIGGSFYQWDAGVSPRYTRSSMRITELAKTLGFDYAWVSSKEDAEQARRLAADMPVYPREGCIAETERFIVVKIAEDPWYGELAQ